MIVMREQVCDVKILALLLDGFIVVYLTEAETGNVARLFRCRKSKEQSPQV